MADQAWSGGEAPLDSYGAEIIGRLTLRLDDVSSSLTYVGKAMVGTLTSLPMWQIQRLLTSGTVLAIEWPDGSADSNFIWDDRATYTYS